ncbi:hypothetical protein RB620_24470 [Paenibacillus sp. LHD-117]|uniref:hypothetical protein n=1 Tax=Paenibacillus sp. LHD-117 TaxID=3071412 RepID=UPI0027E02786|nr:hypothetical protein [Paenibacillus sp. LHD-117]MDQ6422591.1 hypothetical protein [Paenibacillus sp. LHD-117]
MKNRWWSWFSSDEIAGLGVSIVIIIAFFSLVWEMVTLSVVLAIIAIAYLASAALTMEYYRKKSKELGLSYYFVMPVHVNLARLFVRKEPIASQNVYKLHVNARKMKQRKSMKASIRCMNDDLAMLSSDVWGENPVFIGNTYTDFGAKQRAKIQSMADLVEYEGVMTPVYFLVMSKAKFSRKQEEFYGRVYYMPDRIVWRVCVIRPRSKGEATGDYGSNKGERVGSYQGSGEAEKVYS